MCIRDSIKTADMLDLPVPEVEYHNIAVKPSQVQKDMVASLGAVSYTHLDVYKRQRQLSLHPRAIL